LPSRAGARGTLLTVGIDTGGTFTDLVAVRRGEIAVEKVPSTPDDPSRAALDGLARLALPCQRVVHGTTVALNALLTGDLARTALVTCRGMADLLEIGRQDRPDLYALHPVKPSSVVPRELRFEIGSRAWPDPSRNGRALVHVERPSARELAKLRRAIARARPDSIAVCLLHSYADPEIEREVARALGVLGLPVTCSADLHREYREVERFSTAVVNAALVPKVRGYLEQLGRALGRARLELMQSSGGTLTADQAGREPVRILLSGPAGGVVGASQAAREAGFERMVGLDMGGTSTDVAYADLRGRATLARDGVSIAGYPIAVPALDIHTIGCGGGSLLQVDAGGVLHVGPASAGADPGPVAYGHSDEPTLTDAHVLLGHVAAGAFLAGRLELDTASVRRAFERLGRKLGVAAEEAALASLDVARAAMRRALGVMTMQRGSDPKLVPLVAFGGAGGLHAAALAEALGMPGALVPRGPGVLSALGMALAQAVVDRSATALVPLASLTDRARGALAAELARDARSSLRAAGHPPRAIEVEVALALRYAGQSFELEIPDALPVRPSGELVRRFHAAHERAYGWSLRDEPIELVHVRVRALVRRTQTRPRAARARELPREAIVGRRPALFDLPRSASRRRSRKAPSVLVLDRSRLEPGHVFRGPALIEEFSGTTIVPPRWRARVTPGGHLLLQRR
jgi:N-methylhydantoinase A